MVAGTVGPIGFLGLQVAYDLDSLFEIPNVYGVQLFVIVVLTAIIVALVLSGLDKGLQIPSRINVFDGARADGPGAGRRVGRVGVA